MIDALNAWLFGPADDRLTGFGQLLDQRDRIIAAAEAAGMSTPVSIQTAIAQGNPGTAVTEASRELQVVQAIHAADATPLRPQ